jgi:DNA-binding MarR family transcriptional regulator
MQEMQMDAERLKKTQEFSDKVAELLRGISGNNQAFEQACIRYFGVTTSQGGTILALPAKKTLSMNELSSTAGVDNSTMTRMVDQLVEKGLVSRQADEKDRRLVRTGLTPAGQKLQKELAGALAGFYAESLEGIPDEERQTIINSLERLKTAVENGLHNYCDRYCKPQEQK